MKFKQVKGFLLRDFVVTGIIFGMIVSLFIISVASVAHNYNNQDIISSSFAEHYDKMSDNINKLETSYASVTSSNGLDLVGTFNVAFNSVFTVVNMMWESLLIYTNMVPNIVADFNFLDATTIIIFLSGILAIITAYLIFIWISSVTRGKL